VLIATAASVAWLLVAWQVTRNWDQRPIFVSRALVDVYRETVNAGFRPYYDCREEARFADVFEQRQGQALRLAKLPADRRMLGLSYPGGMSRDTTAMLCEVQEKPVMVFVDRAEHDNALASQNPHSDLHVFRQELGPLVLYEISPWPTPSVMGSLELLQR
jgi:hypothetical protein